MLQFELSHVPQLERLEESRSGSRSRLGLAPDGRAVTVKAEGPGLFLPIG